MLTPWAALAKQHLKEHRPNLYKALLQAGTLEQHCEEASNRAVDQMYEAVHQGVPWPEARIQAMRENIYLPSEEEQPNLGENPQAPQH
jgi:hypothetical protein